jgi:hypothetical protein
MSPAHANLYVHVIHVPNKHLHHSALRTTGASLEKGTYDATIHALTELHTTLRITAVLLHQY